MDYKIVPNFLPKDVYNFYLDYFFNSKQMTYEYVDVIGHQEDKSGFFFTRELYDQETKSINQKVFLLSTPLLFYSKISKPIRIKVNCFIKQPTPILSAPHVDKSFPHKVFLYSINTNNGFTILDPDGKNIKIPSVGNQALFFNGNIKHQAVTQTDENIRVNININYLVYMNNYIYPFKLPVYESYILDQEFDIIKKEVFNYLKNNKSNFSHSWDCPTLSDIGSLDRDINNNEYIKNIIISHAKKYYKEWNYKPFELTVSELWVNVAPQGAFQEIHSHENMFRKHLFSGSLYLQTFENSGNIILYNPLRTFIPNMLPFEDDTSYDRKLIESTNKKIILFPSWMEHRVQVNKNTQNRVSLSWNISPIIK